MTLTFALSDAIYHDYQAAVASFNRPFFDHEVWVPRYFAAEWSRMEDSLPTSLSIKYIALAIDPSISDSAFRRILATLKCGHDVWIFNLLNGTSENAALSEWMRSIVTHGCCRLLEHYLDTVVAIEKVSRDNVLSTDYVTHAHAQSVLSLALLYWARFVGMTDSVVIGKHKAVFCWNPSIMKLFKSAYEDFETLTPETETTRYSRPMLWALYIGAWSEQKDALGTDQQEVGKQYFNSRFRAHAIKMGLSGWQDVREVLLGFLHNDSVPPNGSLWFHETFAGY